MNREARVGLTVVAALACLGALVVFLGRIHFSKPGYKITAAFKFVDSLKNDAPVLYGGGVEIGEVDNISVAEGLVKVRLHIYREYKIPRDSILTIHTSGILGEKYVQVAAGKESGGILESGSEVRGMDPGSLDRTLQRVEALTAFLEPLLAQDEFKNSFSDLFKNMASLTSQLSAVVNETAPDAKKAIRNLKVLVDDLQVVTDNTKILIKEARDITTSQNRKNITESLDSLRGSLAKLDRAMTALDSEKGALGTLLHDGESADNLRHILRDLKRHPWKLLWKK